MIDYFLRYANEAAAKQDAQALAQAMGEPISQEWRTEHALPNVLAWRPSQDIHNPDGSITHNYLGQWYVIVALDYQEPVLLNAAALAFALDRDACNAGKKFVVKNNIGAVINDVACQPIFMGSTYPVGGYS